LVCNTVFLLLSIDGNAHDRHHLPEGHQSKPADDWLSRTVARVTASVATEAATALGYEVSFFVSFILLCVIIFSYIQELNYLI
jgi:hypothetical protein